MKSIINYKASNINNYRLEKINANSNRFGLRDSMKLRTSVGTDKAIDGAVPSKTGNRIKGAR